jgi:hypothetical protein
MCRIDLDTRCKGWKHKSIGNFVQVVALFGHPILVGGYEHWNVFLKNWIKKNLREQVIVLFVYPIIFTNEWIYVWWSYEHFHYWSCLMFLKNFNCIEQVLVMFGFWYGGTKDLQVNKWICVIILMVDHVYDYVKSASSMGALLIPKSLYLFIGIKVHKIYVDTIAYTFHIFQLYIPYHIHTILKNSLYHYAYRIKNLEDRIYKY